MSAIATCVTLSCPGEALLLAALDKLPLKTRTTVTSSPLYRAFLVNRSVASARKLMQSPGSVDAGTSAKARAVLEDLEALTQVPAYKTALDAVAADHKDLAEWGAKLAQPLSGFNPLCSESENIDKRQ